MIDKEGILASLIERASKLNKKIVLPESNDIRVLEAANILQEQGICNVILIGKKEEIINNLKNNMNKSLNESIVVLDPEKYENNEIMANTLYKLRKHKGMSLKEAITKVLDPIYFATMLVYMKKADGVVSGASHSSADTLRPALQIIKKKNDVGIVSSFFIMESKNKNLGQNGAFIFSDCGLIKDPTGEELADIAISSVDTFRNVVGDKPKLAFLSFSTKGSADCESASKIKTAMDILKKKNVDFLYDGELQLDCAIIKEVANIKAPESKVAGEANILIFPNLDAGNIGYKIAQRFGNMLAIGPITQGLNAPINDLSRGCSVEDIIGAVSITAIQAEK